MCLALLIDIISGEVDNLANRCVSGPAGVCKTADIIAMVVRIVVRIAGCSYLQPPAAVPDTTYGELIQEQVEGN